jgi:HEAT repeat protein
MACADLLKKMFSSERAEDRERAAWVLGEVGVEKFYQPLIPLFDDPEEKVRLSAIVAAGRLRSGQLTEQLVEQLAHPRLAGAAVQALASARGNMVEVMAAVLGDPTRPGPVRAQAPRVMARLQDPRTAELLCEFLGDPDPAVRTSVVQSLAVVRDRVAGAQLDVTAITAAVRAESAAYFELLAIAQDLRLDDQTALLSDALAQRGDQVLQRLLALLGLKYTADTIELVRTNLESAHPNTRANAVEVLDNLLANDEKPYVIPLVEDAPPERKLESAGDVLDIRRTTRQIRLEELLASKDEWLRLSAAVAVGAWRLETLGPRVRDLLSSGHAVARETALYVLQQLHHPEELRDVIEILLQDPAPTVRRYAEFVAHKVA